jgi:hypothetical protein
VLVGERTVATAFEQGEVEDGEEVGVGVDGVALKECFGAVGDKKFIPPVDDADGLCDFRDGIASEDGKWSGGFGPNLDVGSGAEVGVDPVDMIGLLVEAVEAELVLCPEQDQDADSEPDGETGDIDETVEAIAADVAPGGLEIAF